MSLVHDIIIIGAGPAGLCACLKVLAARPATSVLLVDKVVPWEKPIACAEGVWTDQFREAVDVKPGWVRFNISTVVLHSADGSAISHTARNAGCIIDRARMQSDMASRCAALGAVVRLGVRVIGIEPVAGSTREVRFADGTCAQAAVVVDASGPIAGLGKKDKIVCKPPDLEPACFVIAEGAGIEPDAIHVYLGRDIAPGGYAWAFPREKNAANIGIVLGNAYRARVNIREKLDSFLSKNYPHARVLGRFAGTIPCEGRPLAIAAPRLLKAGDAASAVNPFTRAGIVEAMESGTMAGAYALKTLLAPTAGRVSAYGEEYRKRWYNSLGKKHGKLSKTKDALVKIPDADYDKAFATLSKIPLNKRSISKIIGLSLGRFPRLVLAMRHLM
jgi:flavin-dependent dehydrogenase